MRPRRHSESTENLVPQKTWWHLYLSSGGNRWRPNPVRTSLRELGIDGQRSHEKHLPDAVFGLPKRQIGLFLQHLVGNGWTHQCAQNIKRNGTMRLLHEPTVND